TKQPTKTEPVEPAAAAPRGDIGATSTGETERLETRNEELENKCRQLEFKIEELKTGNAEVKTKNAKLHVKLEAAQEMTVAASSESASANTVTAGDPGPIPDVLLRKPKATGASESSEDIILCDAVDNAFSELEELASECREVVDNAPESLNQTPRIQS